MNGGDYAIRFRDGSGTVVSPVLPTPRLLDEGWRPVEAYETKPDDRCWMVLNGWDDGYREAEECARLRGQSHCEIHSYPPIWRVRDDSYDPEGTEYVRVTVERVPYTWTCEHCERTWTGLDQFGPEFEEFARHKD